MYAYWRGFRAMSLGRELSKKQYKTAHEIEVVKSYKATMRTILLSVLIFLISMIVLMTWAFSSAEFSGLDKRYGKVMEDGNVRYIQNTERYITLEELGIDPAEVNQGDEILMFFDRDDRVKNAVPYDAAKQDTGTRLTVLFAVISFFVIVFIVEGPVLRGTAGRMFSNWVGCDDDVKASLGHL